MEPRTTFASCTNVPRSTRRRQSTSIVGVLCPSVCRCVHFVTLEAKLCRECAEFTSPSDTDRVWSNRFAIAGKDGIVVSERPRNCFLSRPTDRRSSTQVKPEHEHQPNGSGEPWGNGRLASNSSSTTSATSSLSTTNQGWHFLPWLESTTQTAAGQAYHWQPGPATPTPSVATPAWPNQALAPAAQPTPALSGFQYGPACSTDTACPEEAPCCSEFGFCGAGR